MIPCNLKSVLVYALTLCLFIFTLAGCFADFSNQHYISISEPSSELSEEESPASEQDWRDINLYTEEEMGMQIYLNGEMDMSVTYEGETLDNDHPIASFGKFEHSSYEDIKNLSLEYHDYNVCLYGAERDGSISTLRLSRSVGGGVAEERIRFEIPYTKDTVITFKTNMHEPTTTLYVGEYGVGVIDETLIMDDQYYITHGPEVPPKVRLQVSGPFDVSVEYEGQVLDEDNTKTNFGGKENWAGNPDLLGYPIQSFVLDVDKEYDVYIEAAKKGELEIGLRWWDKYLNQDGTRGIEQSIRVKKGTKMYFHLTKTEQMVLFVSSKGNDVYDKTYTFDYRQDSFDFHWR